MPRGPACGQWPECCTIFGQPGQVTIRALNNPAMVKANENEESPITTTGRDNRSKTDGGSRRRSD